MKPIIGVLMRKQEDTRDKFLVNKEITDMIIKYGGIPLGIYSYNNYFDDIKSIIDICSGFILPGGDDYEDIDINIIKYLYEKDTPLLGICLGMQTMGCVFNGTLNKFKDYSHLKEEDYVHDISINKNSSLYKILNKDKIMVNSRHKEYLEKTDLSVSSVNDVIESIEDKNKKFFIGVQWHPESISNDINTKLLMEEFIKKAS